MPTSSRKDWVSSKFGCWKLFVPWAPVLGSGTTSASATETSEQTAPAWGRDEATSLSSAIVWSIHRTSLVWIVKWWNTMSNLVSIRSILVTGLFSNGYFPIEIFFKDISPSDKCLPEFLPIMDFYPSCFAHQEKSLPGFIPITILPIIWWIFTHQNFAHQIICSPSHREKPKNHLTKSKFQQFFNYFHAQSQFKGEACLFNLTYGLLAIWHNAPL